MKTKHLHLTILATMIASMMGLGCASSTKIEAPSKPMTVLEAQKSLVESLSKLYSFPSLREARFTRQKLTFKADDYFDKTLTSTFTVKFAGLGTLTIDQNPFSSEDTWHCVKSDGKPVLSAPGRSGRSSFPTDQDARTFVNCLLTLKKAALASDVEEADFAAFSAAAKTWLAAETKPPMSDDARSSKVMAEDAFKRKDFAAAMDAYVRALGKHPMWPEGHYNAALLAAEIEDYEVAAKHMRRYLALAPDAKDASAAKDKYLLWQQKAKE